MNVASIKKGDALSNSAPVVIVGASLSGLRAAETLRSEGHKGEITLVGDELHLPYDRPPLSKQVLSGTWAPEKAVLADRTRLDELAIQTRLGKRAVSLDVEARRVTLEDGSTLDSQGIVLSTGAHPRQLPGTEAMENVFVLRTLDDALAIRHQITIAGPGCKVTVIGAGFIGSEVASSCADLGCKVTVVEMLDVPLSSVLGVEVGKACAALHSLHGVDLRLGVGVKAVHPARGGPSGGVEVREHVNLESNVQRAQSIELTDGTIIDADIIVVGIGVVPTTQWLEDSGLVIDNGIVCDKGLFCAEGIVSCGDIARWPWDHDGEQEIVRIEHWQVAAEEGVAAARNLISGRSNSLPFNPVPYFWSDQFGIRIQVLGRPRPDDEVQVVDGAIEDGKFLALYGRNDRLRAAVAISKPRQLMGFRPLLQKGSSWKQALEHSLS